MRISATLPWAYSLEVTTNGIEATKSGMQFLYVREPLVHALMPERGLATGPYSLFISGANFVNSTALGCRFDSVPVRGVFLSPSMIVCTARPFSWDT